MKTPSAYRFFIASLIYLVLGLLAQAVTIFDGWLGFNPLAYTAVATAQQLLLVGWLTQLGMALVYDRRAGGSDSPARAAFVLFNVGLPLAILGQPGLAAVGSAWLGAVAAFGGLLQLFGGLVFVYSVWKNLKLT